MAERLDDERIEILRTWGAGLSSDAREELRAAGKAITVLIDEIDRLHVDLWNARARPASTDVLDPLVAAVQGKALHERLSRGEPPA